MLQLYHQSNQGWQRQGHLTGEVRAKKALPSAGQMKMKAAAAALSQGSKSRSCWTGNPFIKEMLNTWAMKHRVIPQDWKGLVSAVLKAGQPWQWLSWRRHEATKIEPCNLARGINVTKGQLLAEEQMWSADVVTEQWCLKCLMAYLCGTRKANREMETLRGWHTHKLMGKGSFTTVGYSN